MKTYQTPNGVYKPTSKPSILQNLNVPFTRLRWDQQVSRWLVEDLYGSNGNQQWGAEPNGERYQNTELVACGVETIKIDLMEFSQ